MRSPLTISLVQSRLVWHQPHTNRENFEKAINKGPKSDLWLLPEMFTTGFTMEAARFAEPVEGESYGWLRRTAIVHKAFIGGSVIIKEGDHYYNRFLVSDPAGNISHYDKRHLFTMAGEHQSYSPGNTRTIIDILGWRVNLQVCYDLRFPVFSRNTTKEPYDLMLYVANWPVPRISAWDKLLMARAIENQCFVAGVNRVGADENGMQYNGHSVIVDPYGEMLADAGTEEKVITARLDHSLLEEFRKKFPVLNDADHFRL